MKPKKIFEIPFPNAAHDEKYYVETFEPFVAKYKDWIHDIYFTYTLKGSGDAMGGSNYSANKFVLKKSLELKEKYNIKICPTINNVFEYPSIELGKKFLDGISRLIAMGVDMIQVPFVHWMMIFNLKDRFPEVLFKDTVLQRTYTAQDVWLKAMRGFDIINIDRNLMRDEDTLKRIKKAKNKFLKQYGRDFKVVLLANETCRGKCEIMDEHYMWNAFNNAKTGYFQDPISFKSCSQWFLELEERLKTTNFIPLKEEYDRLLQYVDIIKLHGRGDLPLWEHSMKIIEDYVQGKEIIGVNEKDNLKELAKYPDLMKKFAKVVKNCKIECWDCNACKVFADKIKERILKEE